MKISTRLKKFQVTPKSLGSHLYYVTFINDHLRKTWVYFRKSRGKVFTKFQEFNAEVENLTERRIKILRSDNGGEYTSKEIVAFCKESGIKRELTIPYYRKQNGVGELKNQSIEESVKAMLHDQDLLKFLWGEETKTSIYIRNRRPHRSLDNLTLEEVFTWKKPSVDHLQIFRCPVYTHIVKNKRKMLNPSGMRGTFVGYNNSSKACRIYTKEGHRIEVSRDVVFDESIAFKESKDLPMDFDDEELLIL